MQARRSVVIFRVRGRVFTVVDDNRDGGSSLAGHEDLLAPPKGESAGRAKRRRINSELG